MLVSNNNLLNILLPNDNKVLKEALKDADSKTLQDMVKNKSTSVNDILKNLFNDIKNGTKSNSNIENILKNPNLFKDLGSFSKSLVTVLNQLDSQSNLQKFKPALESFFKDIKNLDEKTLKEQLGKSGVFLESKIANANIKEGNIPKNIEKLLNQIQNIIKNIDTPAAKQINELINKIVEDKSSQTNTNNNKSTENMKSLVSLLQNVSKNLENPETKNLSNLTNQLKSMASQGSLVESKLENSNIKQNTNPQINTAKEQINTQTKELLTQIKNEVITNKDSSPAKNILNQIDNLLKSNDLFTKNEKLIEPKNLLNNLLNSNEIKQASTQSQNISNLVLNLKNISESISNLESKTQNFVNITNGKNTVTTQLKENLANLKSELQNLTKIDSKSSLQIISKLENIQNIFTKIEAPITTQSQNMPNTNLSNNFSNNFANNLNTLILSLKENITNLSTTASSPNSGNNASIQNQIMNIVDKIETSVKEAIQTYTNNQGLNPQANKNEANPLSNDMKTVLLQMQEELANKTDVKSQEMFKQVDKMLMQIDYHQLLSLTSNSNYVYVPFFWDMLEDGSIEMKKTDEDKFYCQINLNLKDYGKVDLMLSLYDTNKLDLTIHAQREHFKLDLSKNIQKLKQALNNVDLIPINIKILDLKEEEEKTLEEKKVQTYTNPYDNNSGTNVDIRV
ncbi:flagellar hook-length control protein FliK [Poseidonibacter lekithochrous]|uniref:flagellar hook-length control protein FliK n=1 Tax=Poseidonibacter lekithochrous TaxID=1904463 RepID=UPI0008FC271A|nr:flagellar hook-length control protein FliK [Poseidonibacter lekithochrous]QKJ23402.1 flagellar hook-length control protein FliK [Poseidonibacter lekithochrous]